MLCINNNMRPLNEAFFYDMNEMKKIAIQGYPGAFHEIAARQYFHEHEIDIIPSDTFEDVISFVEKSKGNSAGVMAIENSIAGSLIRNYKLLNRSNITIVGEIYLRIKQNLLVLPGSSIEDITEVHSHYMAIAQCASFFKKYPNIKLVESEDTALSARKISQNHNRHIGAIASELAAELYGLNNIGPGIETNKQNYTRFFIIDKKDSNNGPIGFNKTSISFSLSHEVGSLFHVLKILNQNEANLTKIHSMPIPGKPWEYLFFIDFILLQHKSYDLLIKTLKESVHDFNILGNYNKGIHYEN